MADLADIEKALVAQIAALLFPGLAYAPGGYAPSAAGLPAKLYRGWPEAANLDGDLAAGRAHISIYPEPGMSREKTRWAPNWIAPAPAPVQGVTAAGQAVTVAGVPFLVPSLTVAATGRSVTYGGTGGSGQVAAITHGTPAARQYTAYRLMDGDTPATVAAALAALIAGAMAVGPVLALPTTIGDSGTVTASVASDAAASLAVWRQEDAFRVSIWAPSPAARDALATSVRLALSAMMRPNGSVTEWLTLGNGEAVRVRYRTTYSFDMPSKDRLWRRDLSFWVEYDTSLAQLLPVMQFGGIGLEPNGAPANVLVPVMAPTESVPFPATLGAIRWDAWYAASIVNDAVQADLAPAQFNARLPFFGVPPASAGQPATIRGSQGSMDAEILAASGAGLSYWAFLGWGAGTPETTALGYYLASPNRGRLRFCMIENFSNVYFQGLGFSAELTASVGLTAQPGYMRVMNNRPLWIMLDTSDADIVYRFGSLDGFQAQLATIRAQITSTAGVNPYMVVLSGTPQRSAQLVRQYGFDAAGSYAVTGNVTTPTPYASLAATAAAWWDGTAGLGVQVVPPVMTGFNPAPRVVTPHPELFGSEATGSLQAYYQDGTATQIATHAAAALAWMATHVSASPAQTALAYAWNEFDEGGWLCPTYLAGNATGDTTRLAALAPILTPH